MSGAKPHPTAVHSESSATMSNDETASVEITESLHGTRLDIALNRLFEVVPSRSYGAKLIERQRVRLNGKTAKASNRVNAGDLLSLNLSFLSETHEIPEPENIPLEIIFEDEHLIAINKPANLVIHPGAGIHSGTLVNAILAHCGVTLPTLGGPARAGIVHRLDRDTTGVMVVAKTQAALTGLAAQFAAHTHGRLYEALVYQSPKPIDGKIETWHIRDPRNRLRFACSPAEGQGKRAALSYSTQETFGENIAAKVRCELETGRTHQIRVQMTHIGCPLIGDSLYGNPGPRARSTPGLIGQLQKIAHRQMLHATTLTLTHPISKTHLAFESKLPDDFIAVMEILRTCGPSSC